jgi:hypothetical protein
MSIFSSIKKLFGFSEKEEVNIESVQKSETTEEMVKEPTVEEYMSEKVEPLDKDTSKMDTVGDIKSKFAKSQQHSNNTDEKSNPKPKKPYRRPKQKKEKPIE